MLPETPSSPTRGLISKIFISSDEPRLRAGWRLFLQTLLLVVISIPLNLVAKALGFDRITGKFHFLGGQVLELILFTSSIYIARRWLDKRSFESLGLKIDLQTLIDILTGIGITFVQMGFIFIAMLGLGWLTFTGFAWQFDSMGTVITSVITFFIIFICVGWNEELLSRGYQMQTIASGINLFWGVVISSAVFGLLHLGNPNATWVSAVGIFFAGIYLAFGYICTKQLWLSIGLHIGWNFFEGVMFGFPVSGLDIYPLLRIDVTGPVLWTGGAFGPEAGLIVLPSLIVGGVLIYLYTKNRDSNNETSRRFE